MWVNDRGEPVQAEYIRQLAHARPALEDQLADIYHVLEVVNAADNVWREETPLDSARATYVAYLRESHLTFNQLVTEVAAVCACVFLQQPAGQEMV
jgi:hypothetical protein